MIQYVSKPFADHLSPIVALIFGPVLWRKVNEWRLRKRREANYEQSKRQKGEKPDRLARIPLPISLPSNAVVLMAWLVLIVYHLAALFLPSGYAVRSDLFLLLDQPINTSTTALRSILGSTSLKGIGWRDRWTEEGLETLLRRLGSWDGRKLHLLLGIDPFVSCNFCTSSQDYVYYSMITRLAQYGVDMFLLGLLTLRFDALNTLDDIVFLIVTLTTGIDLAPDKAPGPNTLRPHRFHWRSSVKYFVVLFAVCELAVLSGFYEFGLSQSRWSHWHANRNIVWHAAIPLFATLILLCPRVPDVPAVIQIVQSLQRTEAINNDVRANLQASLLSQQLLWQDDAMRDRLTDFYAGDGSEEYDKETDKIVDRLSKYAQDARVDVAALRTQAKQAAQSVWANSERVWSQDEHAISTTVAGSKV